ncbi:hypothetical protein ABZ250_15045 [Streptomyces afghaniensis]|jgi:hypothetical protein|uniref:hypothetical protein n=1 Tax=Streptomyces afghaniensis TaxID=66865 RepID=UPI0033A5AA94
MTREGHDPSEDGLTPDERALFLASAVPRGYAPAEELPEPEQPPAGPAGASASPAADAGTAPDADRS